MSTETAPYLDADEFADIRRLVGLAGDDTSTLSDAEVGGRLLLGWVVRRVDPLLTSAGVDMDPLTGDLDTIDWVLSALIYLTASRFAEGRRVAIQGDERTAEHAGPFSVNFRSGADWSKVAGQLKEEGLRALANAIGRAADGYEARGEDADAWVRLDGLSRYEKTTRARTVDDMMGEVEPEQFKGSSSWPFGG